MYSQKNLARSLNLVFGGIRICSYAQPSNLEHRMTRGKEHKSPTRKIKISIFPTEVTLVSLQQWRNVHGVCSQAT